jgi:hypothetical protein
MSVARLCCSRGAGVEGCTEAVMVAHGFNIGQLQELVRVGFAEMEGSKGAKFSITDAGQREMARPRGGAR